MASILHGWRQPFVSGVELNRRIAEAKILLQHVFADPDCNKCLQHLVENKDTAIFLLNNVSHFKHLSWTKPSLDALLMFKDKFRIPDASWSEVCSLNPYVICVSLICEFVLTNTLVSKVVSLFELGAENTLTHVLKLRRSWNTQHPTTATPGGRGYQVSLRHLLHWRLSQHPPKDYNGITLDHIRVKVSIDGARYVEFLCLSIIYFDIRNRPTKRRKQEVLSFDILTGRTRSELKSPFNSTPALIYIGEENRETMIIEMKNAFSEIDDLLVNPMVLSLCMCSSLIFLQLISILCTCIGESGQHRVHCRIIPSL